MPPVVVESLITALEQLSVYSAQEKVDLAEARSNMEKTRSMFRKVMTASLEGDKEAAQASLRSYFGSDLVDKARARADEAYDKEATFWKALDASVELIRHQEHAVVANKIYSLLRDRKLLALSHALRQATARLPLPQVREERTGDRRRDFFEALLQHDDQMEEYMDSNRNTVEVLSRREEEMLDEALRLAHSLRPK